MTDNYKIKPTIKQKQSLKNIIDNRGNIGKSMKQAGYTEATAKNPSNLTNTIGFQQLVKQIISQDDLINKLKGIAFDTDDKRAKLQAIDILLKLMDLYPASKSKVIGLFDKLSDIQGQDKE